MPEAKIDQSRREFLERMKKTALWAAPVVTAISVAPRKSYGSTIPLGEGS